MHLRQDGEHKARVEEEANKTNPEELLGAAHSACYAMFLSAQIGNAGYTAEEIRATANVTLIRGEAGLKITGIEMNVEAKVPGMDNSKFQELAEKSKVSCPVSQALASVPITLSAKLV